MLDASFERIPALVLGVRLKKIKYYDLKPHPHICTHLESSVEPVLHDGDEFAVAQLTVAVLVKNLKHGVHQVPTQARAGAQFHRSVELVWK